MWRNEKFFANTYGISVFPCDVLSDHLTIELGSDTKFLRVVHDGWTWEDIINIYAFNYRGLKYNIISIYIFLSL